MDPDVAALAAQERLVEAAELASSRGDASTASLLFERACDFERAAEHAARAGEWARALPLALEAKAEAIAERVAPALIADRGAAERVAFQLERRGDHGWAARLLEGIGKTLPAASAYERAGCALEAAALLEKAGDVVGASRVLEARVRREPQNGALLVALGSLLHRYGKTDAAVRCLQKVPAASPERRAALIILVAALERLSLTEARALAEDELRGLGGAVDAEVGPSSRSGPRSESGGTRPGTGGAPSVRARLFGRYEVAREVASSPHARVIECFDRVRAEKVAVKIFAGYDARGTGRDALARFEREVRALGTLDHPNIVPLRDYVPEGPALVLEWMGRGTLERMLENEPLAPARAVEVAQAILAALGEAHRLGIIHRDIKPANVLFDEAGVTRLGDFGVAHLSDLSATATAGVIGTLGYMSPEQRAGHPATVRSDLYGVGALLLEMLTGERPDANVEQSARDVTAVGSSGRVRPSGVHRDLDARHDEAVFALIDTDPARRPADAFAARRTLGALRWPHTIDRITAVRPTSSASVGERPSAARLAVEDEGTALDQWLGRRVLKIPLDASTLGRASLFARADHPALQAVLRVDRKTQTIWLAGLRGAPIEGRPTPRQAAALREALERLHEIGAVHGAVDTAHVLVDEVGDVTLTWSPTPPPTATFDTDRIALARLAERA